MFDNNDSSNTTALKVKRESEERLNTDKKDLGIYVYEVLCTTIDRFIHCEPYQNTTIALWVIKSWCMPAFKVAPILAIKAFTKGAGKSQLLNLIGCLCHNPVSTSNITPAALFRYIEQNKPTVLIDEADTFLNRSEDLRGIVNAGFESTGRVIRCVGQDSEPTEFNVFCPKVIAGIGNLPSTIESRSIVINMYRKPLRIEKEKLRNANESDFDGIKQLVSEWANNHIEQLMKYEPQMPDKLSDRQKDCWEPLLSIAELLGNEIAEQARNAAINISKTNSDEPHINELMLLDVKRVFVEQKIDRLSTIDLINALCEDDEAAWRYLNKGGKITPRQLAQILKQFNISSKQIRFREQTKKGYDIADFQECFLKYLPE
ncbi:hypothetical protein AYK86_04705 [Acinetobacter venetianus]|uniref:DUF3631 domain-containing protein n=1 Tax=Acinetobacter TaxID=469 RepID=UPI000775C669|nr:MULTISPECIES: DUF3631 domain-containing protein [Acinetobacter]KXO85504.1 hypothetical protein AYK86_04705 [Acinetobacter venetianus]